MRDLDPPPDLPALSDLSARLGNDPLLIQAAGGNTSVKAGNRMWIKASGTMLSQALDRDIFVPVDLPAMRIAISKGDPHADQPAKFALGDNGLRPSIETCLHTLFAYRVVLHVHCVNTIAIAVRKDAEDVLASRLTGFDWCFAPYRKPGADLAAVVMARMTATTDVVILGNHGLLVAGDTVDAAEALLRKVVGALTTPPGRAEKPDISSLSSLANGWDVADADNPVHQLSLDPSRLEQATKGSLYPDHVIFCGPSVSTTQGPEPPAQDAPPFLLVPGAGALIHPEAGDSARAMARCLGDVMIRVPAQATLNYLSPSDDAALLDWDAEKYRQAMNAG